MDKVIKEMEENRNIIIDGKFVYELEQELKRLQAENERLKKELKCYEMSFVANLDRGLAERNCDLNEENEKIKQALQAIRKYCEEQNLKADYTACEIIDKINSVIGAE